MIKNIKILLIFSVAAVLLGISPCVLAQDVGDLSSEDIINIVQNAANFLVTVAIGILVIFIAYYGVQIALARDNVAKLDSAKAGLKWSVVGAFVILGVYVIINTVGNIVYKKFF